jgi:hypothetical protein
VSTNLSQTQSARNELPPYLTEREKEELDRLLRAPRKWELLPGPQSDAANSEAFELLYGGEPGGGKTELIAYLARFKQQVSLVLRKSFAQHERTLIPRMLMRYGDSRFYNFSKHLWRWPSEDRRIELGYLDGANVEFDYQGAEYDALFPDELTQFPRSQYLFFFSRVRSTTRKQRQRIVATSNPGGEYEQWVKERWAPWLDKSHSRPAKSGEIRWYRRIESLDDYAEEEVSEAHLSVTCPCEEHGRAWSRSFIRAGVKDNPFIGDEYLRNLDMLPEPLRTQLKRGDWNIGTRDKQWQVIPSAWLEAAHERYRLRTKYDARNQPIPPEGCKVLNALGIDVARGGKCKTVLAPGYDNWYPPLITFPGKDTPDGQSILGQVATLSTHGHQVTAATVIKIDVIGVGSSPYDHLKDRYNAAAMNGGPGSKARDKANLLGFKSRRAQWYWQLREGLDPVNGDDLMIAPDSELDADLTAPTWEPRLGRIVVEPKEEIEKRLGRSPDKGDAFVYVTAQPSAEHGLGTGGFYDGMTQDWTEAKDKELTDTEVLAQEKANQEEAESWFGK